MKTIAFFLAHFLERGTEISTYKLAHYNESILKNKSIIICWTVAQQKRVEEWAGVSFSSARLTYDKFKNRFSIFECGSIEEIGEVCREQKVNYFYTQPSGLNYEEEVMKWTDKSIWSQTKTIQHCIFSSKCAECDKTWVLHNVLNLKNNTSFPELPYIVQLPEVEGDLRETLGIPKEAVVFGGYGGAENLSIEYAKAAIDSVSSRRKDVYFLFANFRPFCSPRSNVIHLPVILDEEEKVRFIQTCDAMLWARQDGETFGLAIAEFSLKNKPVLCTASGDIAHLMILKEKAVFYDSFSSLCKLLWTFKKEEYEGRDWNAYRDYCPEKVLDIFQTLLINSSRRNA